MSNGNDSPRNILIPLLLPTSGDIDEIRQAALTELNEALRDGYRIVGDGVGGSSDYVFHSLVLVKGSE